MTTRRRPLRSARRATSGLIALGALYASLVVASPAPAASSCASPPSFMPTDEIHAGMTGSGVTVLQGNTISGFNVTVLGVMKDAIFLGTDIVLVDITGPQSFLDTTGGALGGMSGSPVYIDGKLIGAVAWGFGQDRTITGVTAAEDMVDLFSLPDGEPSAAPNRVHLSDQARRAVSRASGIPLAQTGTSLSALPVPFGVSGLGGAALDDLSQSFADHGLNVQPFPMSSARAPSAATLDPTPIQPGQPFASALSYGDVTISAIGTATANCGDRAIAYGHPLFYDPPGATSYGMNEAHILAVNQGDLFAFKMGELGDPHGMITQDRFAGEVGLYGVLPSPMIPVTSHFSSPDTGLSRDGRTDIVFDEIPWFIPDTAFYHAYSNISAVWQESGPGSLSFTYTIEGTREDGSGFTVANRWMSYSDYSANYEAYALADPLYLLLFNEFEEISIDSIDVQGSVTDEDTRADIDTVAVSSPLQPSLKERGTIKAAPGDVVTVQVNLNAPERPTVVVPLTVKVPRGARGYEEVTIRGGKPRFWYRGIDDFDQLLDQLNDGERDNDLITSAFGKKETSILDLIVDGKAHFTIKIVH